MKKKIKLFFVLALLSFKMSFGQTDSTSLYLRFPTIPPFNIIKVPDSTKFAKDDLHKRKATLVIIFSPDCEHCQHEVRELKKNINLFKKTQIVMASPVEYTYIKKFYEDYGLNEYPNIIMGRDATFMLGTFYKVTSYPALFLYNKKGEFVQTFDRDVPVQKIADAL